MIAGDLPRSPARSAPLTARPHRTAARHARASRVVAHSSASHRTPRAAAPDLGERARAVRGGAAPRLPERAASRCSALPSFNARRVEDGGGDGRTAAPPAAPRPTTPAAARRAGAGASSMSRAGRRVRRRLVRAHRLRRRRVVVRRAVRLGGRRRAHRARCRWSSRRRLRDGPQPAQGAAVRARRRSRSNRAGRGGGASRATRLWRRRRSAVSSRARRRCSCRSSASSRATGDPAPRRRPAARVHALGADARPRGRRRPRSAKKFAAMRSSFEWVTPRVRLGSSATARTRRSSGCLARCEYRRAAGGAATERAQDRARLLHQVVGQLPRLAALAADRVERILAGLRRPARRRLAGDRAAACRRRAPSWRRARARAARLPRPHLVGWRSRTASGSPTARCWRRSPARSAVARPAPREVHLFATR